MPPSMNISPSDLRPAPDPPPRTLRREFLVSGIKVTASLLAGGALLGRNLAAAGRPAADRHPAHAPSAPVEITSPPALDDSVALLAAYLVQYSPPSGAFAVSGAWKGEYAIVSWQGSTLGSPFSRTNKVLGRYVVARAGAAPAYELDYDLTFGGFRTTLRSTMQCGDQALPGLRQWRTDYSMHPVGDPARAVRFQEDGKHGDGRLEISHRAGQRSFSTARPVLPQWCIVDALRTAPATGWAAAGQEFDLLHDLTSYRPRQTLQPAGVVELKLGGASHVLHGYLLTGAGSEPTHYWVDAQGRTLLITGGLLANAMVAAE